MNSDRKYWIYCNECNTTNVSADKTRCPNCGCDDAESLTIAEAGKEDATVMFHVDGWFSVEVKAGETPQDTIDDAIESKQYKKICFGDLENIEVQAFEISTDEGVVWER